MMGSDKRHASSKRRGHGKSADWWRKRGHVILCLLPPLIVLIASVITTRVSAEFPRDHPTTAYVDEDKIIKTFSDLRRTRNQGEAARPGASASADDSLKYIDDQRRLISEEKERLRRKAADNKNESLYSGQSQLLDKEQELLDKEQALLRARELNPFEINAGRMYWGSVSIIYVCLCITTIVTGLYIIRRMFRGRWKCQAVATLIIVGILAFVKFCHLNVSNYLALPGLIEQTINRDWDNIIWWKHSFEYLIVFMGLFLTAICGTLVWDKAQGNAKGSAGVGERTSLLRTLLYLGAALLVTKVVQSRALLNWALVYLALPDKETSISNIISSMITQESIGYTVFLAALYVPSFIVIRGWAPETVKEANPDATPAEVKSQLKDKGLDLSFWEMLPKILAMLSPLLAGPVAELLKSFSK